MYRSIMIPLDGSEFARHVLPVAVAIAKPANAALRLVRVVPAPISPSRTQGAPPLDPSFDSEERVGAQQYLEAIATRLVESTGLRVSTELRTGGVLDELLRSAESAKDDLIILSTHARGGLRRVVLGSIADALIRTSRVPVLAMRPREPEETSAAAATTREILVALEWSESNVETLEHARVLGRLLGAGLVLLHVIPPKVPGEGFGTSPEVRERHIARRTAEAHELLEAAAEPLRAWGLQVRTRVLALDDPAAGILAYAEARGVVLIVMATHAFHGVDRMMLGSVTDRVLQGARAGVLVHRCAGSAPFVHSRPDRRQMETTG